MIVMRGVDDTSNKQLEQIRPAARSCLLNCGVVQSVEEWL